MSDRLLGMLGVRSLFGDLGCDRFWDVGSAIAVLRDVGNAIAKRSVGIAVWGFGGCAIAVLGVWGCDRFWGVGVRSLFGVLRGCDSEALRRNRCLGCWECDSEALRRNRCLGMLGCDRCFGVWGCDLFWGVGVRSLYFKALNLSIDLKPTQLTLVKKVNVYHLSRKKTHHHK
jgi:hypothetical protein